MNEVAELRTAVDYLIIENALNTSHLAVLTEAFKQLVELKFDKETSKRYINNFFQQLENRTIEALRKSSVSLSDPFLASKSEFHFLQDLQAMRSNFDD